MRQLERQHAATQAVLLAHGQGVLRVRWQAGVVHARHLGLRLQPARNRERVVAMRLHAHAQRLHTLEHDPGVEGCQHHAGVLRTMGKNFSRTMASGWRTARRPSHGPVRPRYLVPECITMSAPSAMGRCNSGVAKQLSTASSAPALWAMSASADVAHLGQRVGGRFGEQQFGVGAHRSTSTSTSVCEQNVVSTPKRANSLANQLDRGAEHGARQHHVVARLEQADDHHQHDGRHAAGRGDAGLGCLPARPGAARSW